MSVYCGREGGSTPKQAVAKVPHNEKVPNYVAVIPASKNGNGCLRAVGPVSAPARNPAHLVPGA